MANGDPLRALQVGTQLGLGIKQSRIMEQQAEMQRLAGLQNMKLKQQQIELAQQQAQQQAGLQARKEQREFLLSQVQMQNIAAKTGKTIQDVQNTMDKRNIEFMAGTFLQAQKMSPQDRNVFFQQKAMEAKQKGYDSADDMIEMTQMSPEQQNAMMSNSLTMFTRLGQIKPEGGGAQSAFGKFALDMGYDLSNPEQKAQALKEYRETKKAGALRVSVTNKEAFSPQPEAFRKALAKGQAERYTEIVDAADIASENLNTLDIAEQELARAPSGALAPYKAQIGGIASALGVSDGLIQNFINVGGAQSFNALANKLVLSAAQNMKGNLSDKDLNFLLKSTINLGNTVAGNKMIIKTLKAMYKRQVVKANFFEQYGETNGNLNGVTAAWERYNRNTPVVSRYKSKDGTPIFYYEFNEKIRQANPNIEISDEVMQEYWSNFNKTGKVIKE